MKKETDEAPQPLVPLTVNEGPTDKELAAARAARIRLGYEKPDPNSQEPVLIPLPPLQQISLFSVKGNETPLKCPTGPEPSATAEVEYIPTEELKPVANVEDTVNVRSVAHRFQSRVGDLVY